MIDYQQRNIVSESNKSEMKPIALSKFPLPIHYSKMEGIFENIHKKKSIS